MQPGILGLLLASPQPAASGQSAGSASGDGDAAGGDLFSSLLGNLVAADAGASQQGTTTTAAASEWTSQSAAAALVAQEVPNQQQANAISQLLNQNVTPQNADALLEQIQMIANQSGANLQAQTQADTQTTPDDAQAQQSALLSQLADAVNNVKTTGEPQKLGDIVSQLPAVQGAQGEAAQGAQVSSVLQLVKQMFANLKSQTATTATAEQASGQKADAQGTDDSMPGAVAQSLQASLFRGDDSDSAPAPEKDKDKDGERDYVEIVPLSANATVPAWVNNIAPVPANGTQVAAGGIDQAIPPLSSGNAQPAAALPSVNLPSMQGGAAAAAADGDEAPSAGNSDDEDDGIPLPQGPHSNSQSAAAPTNANAVQPAATAVDPSAAASALAAPAATQHPAPTTNNTPVTTNVAGNHAPVAAQVQVAVTRGVHEGVQQMTIQLDPADLGRVEVHLHTQSDGQTHLSFVVDKPQTLDSLSRDARSLERSLQDAGVKADAGNMQFNLRQQPQSNLQQGGNGQFGQGGRPQWSNDEDDKDGSGNAPQASAISATQNYTLSLRDGVDIRA